MVVAANKVDLLSGSMGAGAAPIGAAPGQLRTAPAATVDVATAGLDRIGELYPDAVPVSAAAGTGIQDLLRAVDEELQRNLVAVELLVPYRNGDVLALVHTHGTVRSERPGPDGHRVSALVPAYLLGSLEAHRIDPESDSGPG